MKPRPITTTGTGAPFWGFAMRRHSRGGTRRRQINWAWRAKNALELRGMAQILVVDDDALICQALSKVLEMEGHHVLSHTDPRKALEEKDFIVVISDFMMPHVNGIELLAQIR